MNITCSLHGLAWEKLRKCELIAIKAFLVFIVIVIIHLSKLYQWLLSHIVILCDLIEKETAGSPGTWALVPALLPTGVFGSVSYFSESHPHIFKQSVRLEDDRKDLFWFLLSTRLTQLFHNQAVRLAVLPKHHSHLSFWALWTLVLLLSEYKWVHEIMLSPYQSKEVFRLSTKEVNKLIRMLGKAVTRCSTSFTKLFLFCNINQQNNGIYKQSVNRSFWLNISVYVCMILTLHIHQERTNF